MFARLVRFTCNPGEHAAAQGVADDVAPLIAKQPGCEGVTVFGDDYPTPDGTCIRDYIHVVDLAEAHIAALESLIGGGPSDRFNVGTGVGHSVLEVVRAVEEITGAKVPYAIGRRREGDPPSLVADSAKLQRTLGWKPRYAELRDIVATAWAFEKDHIGVK